MFYSKSSRPTHRRFLKGVPAHRPARRAAAARCLACFPSSFAHHTSPVQLVDPSLAMYYSWPSYPQTYDPYLIATPYQAAPPPPPPWSAATASASSARHQPPSAGTGTGSGGSSSVPSGAIIPAIFSPSPDWPHVPLASSPSRSPASDKLRPQPKYPLDRAAGTTSVTRERKGSSSQFVRGGRGVAQDVLVAHGEPLERDVGGGQQCRSSTMLPTASAERYGSQQKLERTGFVMWIGNLPKEVSALQLWHFLDHGSYPSEHGPPSLTDGADPVQTMGAGTAVLPTAVPAREGTSSISVSEFPWSAQNGILSIYVIARSNCAFVNFDNESDLVAMVERCNGVALRPTYDEPPLVARVRHRDEEAEAGVAGQFGKGHHIAFAREWNRKKIEEHERAACPSLGRGFAQRTSLAAGGCEGEIEDEDQGQDEGQVERKSESEVDGGVEGEGGEREHAASSAARRSCDAGGSPASWFSVETNASTDSSLLRHPAFAQRFFILKSRTVADLEKSVETGLWMTQPHNEAALDQAFRNSKDVFIFSANQSGAWFGYARMSSALRSAIVSQPTSPQTATRGSQAAADSSLSPSASTPQDQDEGHEHGGHVHGVGHRTTTNAAQAHNYRCTTGLVVSAPSIMEDLVYFTTMKAAGFRPDPSDYAAPELGSSPASDGSQMSTSAQSAPPVLLSQPGGVNVPDGGHGSGCGGPGFDVAAKLNRRRSVSSSAMQSHVHPQTHGHALPLPTAPKCFSIDWMKVETVPFFASRGVRNPWRDNKQIKVSRDGTELEPSVGRVLKALIDSYTPRPRGHGRGGKGKAVDTTPQHHTVRAKAQTQAQAKAEA